MPGPDDIEWCGDTWRIPEILGRWDQEMRHRLWEGGTSHGQLDGLGSQSSYQWSHGESGVPRCPSSWSCFIGLTVWSSGERGLA